MPDLLSLSSWCLVVVVWLFIAVPWVCLQFVIVVFPEHTHYFCGFLLFQFEAYSDTGKSTYAFIGAYDTSIKSHSLAHFKKDKNNVITYLCR